MLAAALIALFVCLYFIPSVAKASESNETPGFKLLRMVMAGSFAGDPDENLNRQIFAAVLPLLAKITPGEIEAFATADELQLEEVQRAYNLSLAHALIAAIRIGIFSADEHPASLRLLILFLEGIDSSGEQDASLRQEMTEESVNTLSAEYGLPVSFVRFIAASGYRNAGTMNGNISPDSAGAPYGNGDVNGAGTAQGQDGSGNGNGKLGEGAGDGDGPGLRK
jgi:hypothetical protein